jgi:hypothetical protein
MNASVLIKTIKPKVLYLVWEDADRRRYKVGSFTETCFQYLHKEESFIKAQEKGFKGFFSFPLTEEEISYPNPVPVFMRRLPPKNRQNYAEYLTAFGLDAENPPESDFTLLGYTGAHLLDDPYHVLNTFEGIKTGFSFISKVSAAQQCFFSHNDEKSLNLASNPYPTLILKPDPENPKDPNAIQIFIQLSECLVPFGYVHKELTLSIKTWQNEGRRLEARLFRVNGQPNHRHAYASIHVTEPR